MFGKMNLHTGVIGLGTDSFGTAFDDATAFRLLDLFFDAGGVWIDSANVYGRFEPGCENESEKALGRWLRQCSGAQKDRAIIATKGGHYLPGHPTEMRLHAREIEDDLNDSLKTLGVEALDFYWLHRDDPTMPIGEIIETMEELVKIGKIRYYGASNYCARRLAEADAYAAAHGLTGFSAVSNQYSLARVNPGCNTNQDPTLVLHGDSEQAYHRRTQMPLIPFQSTARGYIAKSAAGADIPPALSAAYDNAENRKLTEELKQLAAEQHCSVQTALLTETVKRAEFPMLPITSAHSSAQMKDITDAIRRLS